MSNEITTAINIQVKNGNYTDQFQVSAQYNQSAIGANGGVAALTTSATAVPLGSVTTAGWMRGRNLDATNNVLIGPFVSAAFQNCIKVLPGEWFAFRVDSSATLYWKSSASTVNVEYTVYQN